MRRSSGKSRSSTNWEWTYAGERFVFHINSAGDKTAWTRSDFLEDAEVDRWYHAALVKSGLQYTNYLDGEEFGVVETDEPVPPAEDIGDTVRIGSWTKPFFTGTIDELVVATQAWTISDVRTHRDGGIQGVLDVQPRGKVATSWAGLKSEATQLAR